MHTKQEVATIIAELCNRIVPLFPHDKIEAILFGSYARGDFRVDSDVEIMILLDMSELDLKVYSQELAYMTYDFNLDNDLDIKPIVKNEDQFRKWITNYPFYANIHKEGVILYGAA